MKFEINSKIDWAPFKARVSSKGVLVQYFEQTNVYIVFFLENGSATYTHIQKTTPANADQTDFETNYQPSANARILDKTQITGNDGLYSAFVDAQGRISTNANVTFPEVFYQDIFATNGSRENANVNGTLGSPISFKWSAPANQVWYLENVTFLLNDNANFANTGFGGGAALTNGIQINIKTKGTIQTFCNIKTNYDLIRAFKDQVFSSVATGLLSTDRTYRGSVKFMNRIALDGNLGDYIEMLVRDNLTGMTGVFFNGQIWRLNG